MTRVQPPHATLCFQERALLIKAFNILKEEQGKPQDSKVPPEKEEYIKTDRDGYEYYNLQGRYFICTSPKFRELMAIGKKEKEFRRSVLPSLVVVASRFHSQSRPQVLRSPLPLKVPLVLSSSSPRVLSLPRASPPPRGARDRQ